MDDTARVVERFGFHVRDGGLLASALARPAASMFGKEAYDSIDRKAAALLESLVQNHALIDGNKRTGWTLTVLFLWINGWKHDMETETAFDLVTALARHELSLDAVEREIAAHRVPR